MTNNLFSIQPVFFESAFPDELIPVVAEKWNEFAVACAPEILALIEKCGIAEPLKKIFVFSDFMAKRCVRKPEILFDLIQSGDLFTAYGADAYESGIFSKCGECENIDELARVLRNIRTREMIRIVFREISGKADLLETMKDLSALAEACLEVALNRLYQWMVKDHGTPVGKSGAPQQLAVIGFGKLGGRELNFSSDIDLMFVFPGSGKTNHPDKSISCEEFFARLCHRLIDVIGKNMSDGFVFRVDARLRPYGESGPIAMSLEAMETYYQEQGREWERYALIKARVVAGDKSLGNTLLDRLKPFVYRRYLDYGTFESLREMKRKIEREVTRKGMQANIKLGPGGIREVEFFGQMFQLIRGGVHIAYQQRSILAILQTLVDENNIGKEVKDELAAAYVFLRYVENRLQMADDRQTHSLPADDPGRIRLALTMGFDSWPRFSETLNGHMERVHGHFRVLLARDEAQDKADDQMASITRIWNNLSNIEINLDLLRQAGFDPPEEALSVLRNFLELIKSTGVGDEGRKRIDRLVPFIMKESAASENSLRVLNRIYELIKAIRGRSCYVSLLIENTHALTQLVKLAEASPWIMSFLSHHPLLLDELLDPRTLYAPIEKADLKKEIQLRFDRLPKTDLESQMDDLRVFKQINTLRICAADVAGLLPLMKVSDQLTYLAEAILDRVMEMAWRHMVVKYGYPCGVNNDDQNGFGVIAYGKLGGYELGYASDLDLVFLYAGEQGYTAGGESSPIDNAQFYVRMGQRMIHFMTAMTRTGKLYETDMRLRPSGSSGVLVTHIDGFEDYQRNRAWTWEHQALIKARAITGDVRVRERFEGFREQMLSMKRDSAELQAAICDMRARIRVQRGGSGDQNFDIKNDPGGIIDIEFLVQYLILLHAGANPSLMKWTDIVRQLNSLALADIFDDKTAYILKQAYLVFRYYIHRLTLQERPAALTADRFAEMRDHVKLLWGWYLCKH